LLKREIARGGMGTVYEAFQQSLRSVMLRSNDPVTCLLADDELKNAFFGSKAESSGFVVRIRNILRFMPSNWRGHWITCHAAESSGTIAQRRCDGEKKTVAETSTSPRIGVDLAERARDRLPGPFQNGCAISRVRSGSLTGGDISSWI